MIVRPHQDHPSWICMLNIGKYQNFDTQLPGCCFPESHQWLGEAKWLESFVYQKLFLALITPCYCHLSICWMNATIWRDGEYLWTLLGLWMGFFDIQVNMWVDCAKCFLLWIWLRCIGEQCPHIWPQWEKDLLCSTLIAYFYPMYSRGLGKNVLMKGFIIVVLHGMCW